MKGLLKWKWLVLLIWLVGGVALSFTSPDLGELVREKGQVSIPEGYSSSIASQILAEVQGEKDGHTTLSSAVLVFYREEGLSEADQEEIKLALKNLKAKQGELGIHELISPWENSELKEQLLSADQTTLLVPLTLKLEDRSVKELGTSIYEALQSVSVSHYLTGNTFIQEDLADSAQAGVKKTELITLVFILVVMLAVFRSPITPLVPLITIGITYLAAQSIVAYLAEWVDFPLSNFTQIFLVAVLFGLGTDYCILLLSRFKEELGKHKVQQEAVLATYATAGKTVWFSGLAVLVGFAAVGLSTFKLYQSAAAVAIGIAILLVALSTLVPVFMALLGPKLFWPVRGSLEHRPSKLWLAAGRFALTRPLLSLLIVALVTLPILWTYDGTLSFDMTEEIGEEYPSVKGFKIISSNFEPGEAMPSKVIVKDEKGKDLAQQDYLALVEKISRSLAQLDGVAKVRSATWPTGEPVEQFLVSSQAAELADGLSQGQEGIEQIGSGLSTAQKELLAKTPELKKATVGIAQLVNGTQALEDGVNQLRNGLTRLAQGVEKGAKGAGEIKAGMQTMAAEAEKLVQGTNELLQAYQRIESGLSSIVTHFEQLKGGLEELIGQLKVISASLNQLEGRHPSLAQDEEFQRTKLVAAALAQEGEKLVQGLAELNGALVQIEQGLVQANSGLKEVAAGQKALVDGMDQMIDGLNQLEKGLYQGAEGQKAIAGKLPEMASGLKAVYSGQKELLAGFGQLGDQLNQLTDGLKQGSEGLSQVAEGLGQAEEYLLRLAHDGNPDLDGWHLPEEALEDESFQEAFDTYTFDHGTVAVFDVILDENPYALSSLAKVDDMVDAVKQALKGTPLEDAQVVVSGASSAYADLLAISTGDYQRTAILMLAGITLILIIVLRSLVMPIYLLTSLILTYFTSMAVTELVFVDLLGYSGINWAISFFGFVMLISLGIDYSIFFMHRFNEYKGKPIREALLESMGKMGTVILSAAIILGGTFAAMYPSGVVPLAQIATTVLTGLILYAVVVLPLFVPVMANLLGSANWWPFPSKPTEQGGPVDTLANE